MLCGQRSEFSVMDKPSRVCGKNERPRKHLKPFQKFAKEQWGKIPVEIRRDPPDQLQEACGGWNPKLIAKKEYE